VDYKDKAMVHKKKMFMYPNPPPQMEYHGLTFHCRKGIALLPAWDDVSVREKDIHRAAMHQLYRRRQSNMADRSMAAD
jgi:hypothetical protein